MLKLESMTALVVLAALGITGMVAYSRYKAHGLGGVLPDSINPASKDNVVYQAVSAPFAGSLGARIWEWSNPAAVNQEDAALGNPTSGYGLMATPNPNAPPAPLSSFNDVYNQGGYALF